MTELRVFYSFAIERGVEIAECGKAHLVEEHLLREDGHQG
jgi:hypothetical protein